MKLLFYLIIKMFIQVRWMVSQSQNYQKTKNIYIYIYYVFNCRIGESSNFQIKTDRHASWKFGFISCINDILQSWTTRNDILATRSKESRTQSSMLLRSLSESCQFSKESKHKIRLRQGFAIDFKSIKRLSYSLKSNFKNLGDINNTSCKPATYTYQDAEQEMCSMSGKRRQIRSGRQMHLKFKRSS